LFVTADAFFWHISNTFPETSAAEEVSSTESIPLQVKFGNIWPNISALRVDWEASQTLIEVQSFRQSINLTIFNQIF
jgi:hypothetical protein